MLKILFVCNANIVRSFMAERVLKSLLKRCGVHDADVSSAGLMDMQGAPADMTARQILQEHGIDAEDHRSRVLTETMVEEADLIVTMEKRQLQKVGDQYPLYVGKLHLLKSYLPGQGIEGTETDIRDPYRCSLFHYRLCFAEISMAIGELVKCI
jgi:protein-tyrosine phosphatase